MEINKTKLASNFILSSKLNEIEKKFIIKDNLNDFSVISSYIPKLFEYLWENPKLVSEVIMNCDINDIKETLSYLFMNNFYENILSNNNIENNLMYVLTLLIKDEINNLNNISDCDKFMGDYSKVGYLMNELRKKNDIKIFFKNSILNLISEIESKSSISFSLQVTEIVTKLLNRSNPEKSDSINSEELHNSDISFLEQMKFDKKELDKLAAKYLSTLTVTDFKNKILHSRDNNPDMNDYLNNIINNSINELSYSNLKIMEKFGLFQDLSDKIIDIYIKKFYFIKDFIEKFLSILKENINILPYSIRYFCKIINILIQKKFPDINKIQKNAFISQFFFKKIIKPILADPGMELLINNLIISGFTIPNLNIVNEVLNRLFSGKLFNSTDNAHYNNYTSFNLYFIEKMPVILEMFSKLIDIDLPPFIDDLISDKLDPNFSYDYFELNKDEKLMHYSICFNFQDLKSILNGLSKLQDKIDFNKYKNGISLLKTFERLNTEKNRKLLDLIEKKINNRSFYIVRKQNKENIKIPYNVKVIKKENDNDIGDELLEVKIENYFLIQELSTNNKYKELWNFNSESKCNFNIKEIKTTNLPEIDPKNTINKIKNFFSDLLYNISQLQKYNFSKCDVNNTIEILNSIENYYKLSKDDLDNSIPTEWYCESILNLIKNISEDYTKNDYEKLYDEMEEEINKSVNNLNIEFLLEFINKLKNVEKVQLYSKENLKNLKDLELNQKVKYMIENDYIPVKITFNYEEQNYSFSITKLKIKKEDFQSIELTEASSNSKLYERNCKSIRSFIDKFPDFSIFQEKQDKDILALQKNLSIPKKIKEYIFSIIREHLITEKNKEKEKEKQFDLNQAEFKIYDYIMVKINNKIFPKTYDEDDKLFKNLFKLSWIEPKHIIQKNKNYIFDAFLPDVIKNINDLENEKSPRKKILILSEIFSLISKVIIFNGGNSNLGVDDQIPILNYCIIKAKPNHISSNTKFIQLYRNSLIDKGNDIELAQLIALCDFVKNISYKNLNGVGQEEFLKNCSEVMYAGINNIIDI